MGKMTDQVSDDLMKALEKASTLLQALKVSGVKLRRDAEGLARANCPFPVHAFRSPSFVIKLSEPEYFHCEVCGVKGDVRAYIEALCGQPPDSLPINPFIATAVESQASRQRAARALSGSSANCGIAADAQVMEVYEGLLYELELFDHHLEYLGRRGLSASQCEGNEYRSLPVSRERRLEICESLMADNYCLEGVPGFFRIPEAAPNPSLRGQWCLGGDEYGRRIFRGQVNGRDMRYEVGGLLIPVRDGDFRVTRFEILNDLLDADGPEGLKAVWPPRLSLLTSPGQRDNELNGIARLHRIAPTNSGAEFGGAVWVTDSALRADILSAVFGGRVFGVTNFDQLWGELIDAITYYERVIIALGHQEVFYPARLCREAARRGVEAFITIWEFEEAIDASELLLPTYYWNPIPYEKWWAGLPSEIREQVEAQLLALP